jgi:hypothetical protein
MENAAVNLLWDVFAYASRIVGTNFEFHPKIGEDADEYPATPFG